MSTTDHHDVALLRRYHEHGDLAARDELARRALPLVRSCARRYAGSGEPLDDLVQVGCIGLVKAIDRFDLDSGARFAAFAVPNITGEIKRHFRDSCWTVHVPRAMKELDAQLQQVRERLLREGGEEPTAAVLAAALDEPVERVEEALRAGNGYRAHSLDHPTGEDRSLLDTLGGGDDALIRAEQRQTVREAMCGLTERERRVVFERYFEDRFQREIADDLGVSQMQISRVLRRAVAKMTSRAAATA